MQMHRAVSTAWRPACAHISARKPSSHHALMRYNHDHRESSSEKKAKAWRATCACKHARTRVSYIPDDGVTSSTFADPVQRIRGDTTAI